ncbi:CPA1 family monovalent cation:H+ antiporter [Streptococcus loxodontisalivarius]|uniref:CPA1 family monovalent cation:H+ antiporter n=1 Tax=Streptococcus loxodontisalivarius TaxID=1349415 RepID=A0ABS2PUS0_9STRE|nr:sodium:proton antiporter [Streptococcus loxodontisalivarius]MBM7643760.1 CPA1 family monovalent cation:H+ antiporter [Streptococcus loxodontisalivarius]
MLYLIVFLLLLAFSNVLNRLFTRIPLPLVQVALGIGVGLVARHHHFSFDSDLFLALVIGPLLFREAAESNVTSILKNWHLITFLIFPVVFMTTLGIGFVGHSILGIIPLAAFLAIGAALGPTDLVAFASLSGRFAFPKKVENILKGEGLLNDASGLVAFQVAVTALSTGQFSLGQASWSLLLSIMGGLLMGFLTAILQRYALRVLSDFKVIDIASVLLLELSLPLVTFFLAEEIHASGIIAVVVAGIMNAARFKKITLFAAQVDTVTETVWETVTFILNGLVFLILGVELAQLSGPIFASPLYDNLELIGIIISLTVLLFVIRWAMIWFYFLISKRLLTKPLREYANDILTLTFSGVKGTVSVATILLLPTNLEEDVYALILFVVAGVTLVSFLTGIVILPRLAQPKKNQVDNKMQIAILNEVLLLLEDDLQEASQKAPIYAAIDNYHGRIEQLILKQEDQQIQKDLADLQMLVLSIESDGLEKAFEDGRIQDKGYHLYQQYLRNLEHNINRTAVSQLRYSLIVFLRFVRRCWHYLILIGFIFKKNVKPRDFVESEREEIIDLYLANTEIILESFFNLKSVYNPSLIEFLQDSRLREAEIIGTGVFIERVIARAKPTNIDEMLRGYYLERKLISEYEAEELISHRYAKRLRREVNELESYSLKDNLNSLPYDVMRYTRRT